MTLDLDFTDDYLSLDTLEPVTLEVGRRTYALDDADIQARKETSAATNPLPRNGNQVISVSLALRRSVSHREIIKSGGTLTGQDLTWIVAQKEIVDYTPKIGDAVVDDRDNRRWTVLDLSFVEHAEIWKLSCRDIALAWELEDEADIERATVDFDKSGASVKRFPPDGGVILYEGIGCRIQPTRSQVVEERGIRGFQTDFEMILDREVDVTNEDRVKFRGRFYEIRGYRQSEVVGEPPVVDLVLLP